MASLAQTTSDIFINIRTLVGKDTNTLSDATMLRMANFHYLWLVREINESEYVNGAITTDNLVKDQQAYTLPIDDTDATGALDFGGGLIDLLRVEVAMDSSNWFVAPQTEFLTYPLPAAGNAPREIFTQGTPAFALFNRQIFFYPIPDQAVTDGFKIFWIQRPAELTAASDIPDIDKEFLNVLSLFIKADVYEILGRIQESQITKQEANSLLERAKALQVDDTKTLSMTTRRNIKNYE